MYIILELQTASDGTVTHIFTEKETYGEALQTYFQTLVYACVTTLPCHGVMVMTNEGEVLKAEFYKHPQAS